MRLLFVLILVVFTCPLSGAEPEAARRLIIHADDAGMSHSVNLATIEAMEKGLVSSASIMVPCPWFPEFAKYARENPQRCYGIHLTLNSEWTYYRWGPVAPRDKVPSLVDPEGFLWDNVQQVAENVRADEVRIELRAQVERAKKFGVPLSHLDTHMGALVSRPDLLEVYVELGREYNLPLLFMRQVGAEGAKSYPALAARHAELLRKIDDQGLVTIDHLLQFYDGGNLEERRAKYLEVLQKIPPGVSQLIIHCGFDNEELRAITHSSARRDQDRQVFSEPAVKELLEKEKVEIVSWKQLSDEKKSHSK